MFARVPSDSYHTTRAFPLASVSINAAVLEALAAPLLPWLSGQAGESG